VRRPNRAAVYDVAEAMEFAEQKLVDALWLWWHLQSSAIA